MKEKVTQPPHPREVKSLLVKHDAQLDAVDQDNQTYADYAREIGRDTIAEYIDTMLTGN